MKIFKYRNFSANHIDAVLKNEIWFSLGSQFNDPFDSRPPLKVASLDSMRSLILEKVKNAASLSESDLIKFANLQLDNFKNNINSQNGDIADIVNRFSQIISRCFISCFSEVNNSLLMWSHYARNHEGFCVEYDLDKITKEVDISDHGKVVYENNIKDFLSETKLEFFEKAAKSVLFQKCEEWSYEKEYRLVHGEIAIHKSEVHKKAIVSDDSVVAIYFGCQSKQKDRESLMSSIKNKNVEFFHMRQSIKSFSVYEERCYPS